MKLAQTAQLDPFESLMEESFKRNDWKEVDGPEIKNSSMLSAKSTKSLRTNIRLSPEDAIGIKRKAAEYGLGYQTLIASIIHRYVTGRLVDAN